MHLIQRMKIWKELRRLEQRAREQPSPSTFVDLGQVFINLDLPAKAAQAADDGLSLFPDSVELRQLGEFARRSQRKARIRDLQARLLRSVSPRLYRELAQMHLELGDVRAVESLCNDWSRRFPDDVGPWLMLGQTRLQAFYRDLAAREGQAAVRCLQRAVDIDASNHEAHRLLGEFLFRVGAVEQARAHLDCLQTLCGDDPEVQQLLRQASAGSSALPSKPVAEGRVVANGPDLDLLLTRIESTGALPNPAQPWQRPGRPGNEALAQVRAGLAQLAEQPLVRKAAYIKGSRALVKGEVRDSRDPFLRIVRVVARAAQRFARRIDVGNANKAVLRGPFGLICICTYGEVVAAVQCSHEVQVDAVLAELQELVAGSLYLAGVSEK